VDIVIIKQLHLTVGKVSKLQAMNLIRTWHAADVDSHITLASCQQIIIASIVVKLFEAPIGEVDLIKIIIFIYLFK
jgi:hypothetical protein